MTKPPYRLRVPAELVDLIRSLHPELKRKLRAALRVVLDDPTSGKTLRDELEGFSSYSVGRLRVIYRVRDRSRVIELLAIGPRARIYEATLRQIRRRQDPQ